MLRPDEAANRSVIERDERLRSNIGRGAKAIASIATTAAAPAIGSRILPFLSEYIPVDLAMKGISKISPKVGDFLRKGMESGLDVKEGLNFLKDKLTPKESAEESRNIIEQYDPELHQFLDQEIKKGRTPIEAGALAQLNKKFTSSITKLTKDHKTPWSGILQSVYGGQQSQAQPTQEQQTNQLNQQQPGQGQAALMAILQKLQQSRGGQ